MKLRNLIRKAKDLNTLPTDEKSKILDKIPNRYLMKVLAKGGTDEEIITYLEECDNLLNKSDDELKLIDNDIEKLKKKNFNRAKMLIKFLIKKRRSNLIKHELIEKYK